MPPGAIPGVAKTHAASAAATAATPQKTTSGPVTVATLPITGPRRIPKIAAASAEPIISPRRSGGRGGEQPPERAGPGAGAAEALGEAGEVEDDDAVGEGEDDARDPEQAEPREHRRPEADPGGEEARTASPRAGCRRHRRR